MYSMAHVKENERSWDNIETTSAVTKTSGDTSCAALNVNDSKTSDLPKELYWTSGGLAEALRSVASSQLWSLIGFSVPRSSFLSMHSQESDSQLNSSGIHCEDEVKSPDAVEVNTHQEEEYHPKYESEYINFSVPLYQEYWMNSVRKDLHRVKQKGLSEFVASVHLPGLKTPPPSVPSSVSSPSDQQVKSYALWQELPQAKDLLNSLTAREIQLQEAMFELIVSEASYQKSLVVAVNVFQWSAELKQTLSRVEHHVLFSNLKEVCRVSERFLQDLESHLKQDVMMSQAGDIVLNNQKSFQKVYVPYVTNMMYQEALITQLLHSNKIFARILNKLEKDPLCQRQTLKSFLILPFQRITRMILLLENILKRVGGLCLYVSNVKEAIEAVRKIVAECDRNVQQMKSTEFLVCLQKLVDFRSVKSIPLITKGRHLLQEGPLKQLILGGNQKVSVVSRRDLYVHLFNDLLLLSLKSGQQFIVQDHALFPANVRAEGIKTEIFGLPPDSLLLHLTKNQNKSSTSIILAARTRLEKETWIRRLSSDIKNEMP